MSTVENVSAGKPKIGGAIFRAPLGSVLPTGAAEELADTYKGLGYCSEDGVTNENTASTSQVKAWGGDIVLETQTEKPDRIGFTLIEATNAEVLKTVYGDDNVTGTDVEDGITIKANSTEQGESIFVIDMILRNNVLKRIVIPRGKVSNVGTITYKDDTAIGYATTLSCMPDGSGNTHYEYIIRKAAQSGAGQTGD